MCIILDANTFGPFRDLNNEDMDPVRKWLYEKNGRIVYSDTPKIKNEWARGGMNPLVTELSRAGKLKLVSEGVQEKENELKGKIESNDEHIIALAIIAGVEVLVSMDKRLIGDFKNYVAQGRVYQKKAHAHLLTKDTCP